MRSFHWAAVLSARLADSLSYRNPWDSHSLARWRRKLAAATTTTTNAAFITGDSPSRPNPSEWRRFAQLCAFYRELVWSDSQNWWQFQYRRGCCFSCSVDPTVKIQLVSSTLLMVVPGHMGGTDTGLDTEG